MPAQGKYFKGKIFDVASTTAFNKVALELFNYQCSNNALYARYINLLGLNADMVKTVDKIPYLPIEFFKTHAVTCMPEAEPAAVFTSSSTTGLQASAHRVYDLDLYEQSFIRAFELFYGPVTDYCILALLPSYLEREGSSLVYMADKLIKLSSHADSDFYLYDTDRLVLKLEELKQRGQKTLLLGVSFALLDLADHYNIDIGPNCIVMETGGMKGRRKELTRLELHERLSYAFRTPAIHSEYGMTEMLSQGYSLGNGQYKTPPWVKISVRDINDPFSRLPVGATGGVNVIDLANIDSCAFLSTSDLGRVFDDGTFEILGRFDNSDVRGCNLLVA
jgi:phenylacetate-coenzyme A ligase PaaK-like adenylate-forming protein